MPRRRKKMTSWGPRPEWLQRIVDTEVPPGYQARLTANHERLNREIMAKELTHAELVTALAKPGETIAAEINGSDAHLIHMVMGISGEAGELLDAIKKCVIYRKPLDRENVIEELGDLEFYMEGLRQGLGITRDACIEANKAKLAKRYQSLSYSDQAAQERADKVT